MSRMCTTFASRSLTIFAISTRWPTTPPTRAVTAPSAPSLWKLSRRVAAANSLPAPATATTPPAAPPPRGIKSSSSLARLAHGTARCEPFLYPRASCASFCQKDSFRPSWITRFGSPMAITVAEDGSEAETQQVRAKMLLLCTLGEPVVAFRGFSQFVWFRTLKTSARNCILKRSVSPKFFSRLESRFQKFGPCTILRPLPCCPGGGMQKNVCVPVTLTQLKFGSAGLVMSWPTLYITGPSTPFTNCTLPLSSGPLTCAKLTCAPLVVREPLVTLYGSPLWYVKMPVKDQPPTIWFAQLGMDEATFLPLPMGSSYSKLVSRTCLLLKSESARSRRQLRISVGVRLFVVLKPPPVAAPVGSIDMSSMDLLKV